MKALITGATGFLGRHLCPFLEEQRWELTKLNSKNCDLTNQANLLKWSTKKFDYIFHLAAWTKAGDFCLHHQGEQWLINQQINTNVLWFWKHFQENAQLIAMGTSCAYPDGVQTLEESEYMNGEPSKDLYTYALTKRMLLQGMEALNMQYGMKYKYLIPSTLYGPLFEASDNHFIFDLIKKIYRGKFHNEKVVLWGDGHQIRELIYSDDAVNLIYSSLAFNGSGIWNLTNGAGVSIREYAEVISKIFEFDSAKIEYDTDAPYVGVKKRSLSTKKLLLNLPNFEFTSLPDGCQKTIAYFVDLNSR